MIQFSAIFEIHHSGLNAKRLLLQETGTCWFSIGGVCEVTSVLVRFNFGFSFLEKTIPLPSPYFAWILKHQVIFIFKTSGKVSSLFVLMVGFEHLRQECPLVSFFFAKLGVFLEHSSGRRP